MKFIDECTIEISAGKGGNGIVSFRREAKVPRGGPDGGDGGNGGSVYFIGDSGVNTLLNVKYMQKIRAENGENGRSKNQYGHNGKDIIVKVPFGTLVYKDDKLLCDVTKEHQYLIAKGGIGGKGNTKFKSSFNTAPRISENGLPGQNFKVHLILKVLADIGFVGKPSAGKSTLLSRISNASPKIADYDFTTLTPQLGLVKIEQNSFVAADLPGLIVGASQGKGLGHDFLKHIERCYVIAHIIDFGAANKNPQQDYEEIRQELSSYSLSLENRSEVIIANKNDLENFNSNLQMFKKSYPKLHIVTISALKNHNLIQLKHDLFSALQNAKKQEKPAKIVSEITIKLEDESAPFTIIKESAHIFNIIGSKVQKIHDLIPLSSPDNIIRFNRALKKIGIWKALEKQGIKNGDIVKIFDHELEWKDDDKKQF